MHTLIDVIVPVYNTPQKDIDLCFNSILGQDFEEWRLCVIDDGSRTEIADYLDEWGKRDTRIEIYHYKNGGPPVARNRGLSLITAPYFMLVDSDDILKKDFMSHSYKICSNNNLDMVVGSIERTHENNVHIEYLQPKLDTDKEYVIYSGNSVRLILDYAIAACPCVDNKELAGAWLARLYPKLISSEVFKKCNISFESEMFNHDDNMFSFDCYLNFDKVGLTDHIYYQYIEHSYSIVHRKASEKIFHEEINYIKALKKREPEFLKIKCGAAVANRYLIITTAALILASICKELNIYQVYDDINELIAFDTLYKMIKPNRYSLGKREKALYSFLGIKNHKIRKSIVCGAFSLYGLLRRDRKE